MYYIINTETFHVLYTSNLNCSIIQYSMVFGFFGFLKHISHHHNLIQFLEEMSPSCCAAAERAGHSEGALLLDFTRKAADACPWLLIGLVSTVLLQSISLPTLTLRRWLSHEVDYHEVSRGKHRCNIFLNSVRLYSKCALASLLGLATPLCSCGALPLAVSLSKHGVDTSAVVSFLTAAQSAGLDSAAITIGMLGWKIALLRVLGAFFLSVNAGIAIGSEKSRAEKRRRGAQRSKIEASCNECCDSDAKAKSDLILNDSADPGQSEWPFNLQKFVQSVYKLLDEIWPVLFVGFFFSVLVERHWGSSNFAASVGAVAADQEVLEEEWVPKPDWWDDEEDGQYPDPPSEFVASSNFQAFSFAARLTVVVGALPFQLCEHGVVSFASALHKAGVSYGTAHAFLLAAPATNLSTIGALANCTGDVWAALKSGVAISLSALLVSYAIDLAGESAVDLALNTPAETILLPLWWTESSSWVCASMVAVSACFRAQRLLSWALNVR